MPGSNRPSDENEHSPSRTTSVVPQANFIVANGNYTPRKSEEQPTHITTTNSDFFNQSQLRSTQASHEQIKIHSDSDNSETGSIDYG